MDMNCKCIYCGREYVWSPDNRKGHTKLACNSCTVNAQRVRTKKRAVEYLGGKCKVCGYCKTSRALSFHHRDSTTKEFNISSSNKSWYSVKSELDKCDLLCMNCHMEEHDRLDGGERPYADRPNRIKKNLN